MDVHDYFPKAAALLVTIPNANAAKVAERAGRMTQSLERRLIGVVENMAYMNCLECGYGWYPHWVGEEPKPWRNLYRFLC